MNTDLKEEQQAPLALVTGLKFNVSTDTDYEKMSIMTVEYPNEVSDPRLGFPNFANECSTCGARNFKSCDGHFGVIKFPHSIVHPYYISEVVPVLNKVCLGCKSITKRTKGQGSKGQCKYCTGNSRGRYPKMRFRVSPNGAFGKSAIIVEWNKKKALPADYWDFIPPDEEQVPNCPENMKVLSHAQVYNLLKDVNPELIKKHVSSMESIFLSHFPVTPNSHRVTEITHSFSNGQRLIFDERTRAYKKLVDFQGTSYQLGCHVLDCLNISKLHAEKPSHLKIPKQVKKVPHLCFFFFYIGKCMASFRNKGEFSRIRSTDAYKKMCAQNKKNRSKQVMSKTTGTKSFARVRDEDTIRAGSEPTRMKMFCVTHTRKNGQMVDEASKSIADQFETLKNQVMSESSSSTISEEDIFSQVMGPERHGRVRTYGQGPTPTTVFGGHATQAELLSRLEASNKRNEELQSELVDIKKQMEEDRRRNEESRKAMDEEGNAKKRDWNLRLS